MKVQRSSKLLKPEIVLRHFERMLREKGNKRAGI